MANVVILREDDPDLTVLVIEILEDADYKVIHVVDVESLLALARQNSPCVALVDGTNPSGFDLWWLGPELAKLGVPPVAFTAHASARQQFEEDSHGYVGIISKPFDADEFLAVVNAICWEDHQAIA
jgi:DNA-binding NtrC family response regulator